jgi:tyrosyl-tRNA synthetase
MSSPFLNEMRARGQVHQVTDEAALGAYLAGRAPGECRAYVGFDPTADSLTIGNLVGIMALARFQRAGHTPVALMGGGTGLIGDPSGKSAERQLLTAERVEANVERIRTIFENGELFDTAARNRLTIVNNAEWLGKLGFLEALRDIGKHFSVNMMIQKDSVRERLHNRDQGISYTEFSYMILQAYDFAHLYEKHGVTLQMGGSDQFGNIVAGLDLVRRKGEELFREIGFTGDIANQLDLEDKPEARQWWEEMERLEQRYMKHVGTWNTQSAPSPNLQAKPSQSAGSISEETRRKFTYTEEQGRKFGQYSAGWKALGLTWPLVTKADGTKFGKTESGAVWLTADRTSPYAYYQFWLNAADADVGRFLRTFTFLPVEEIAAVEQRHQSDLAKREAQRILAMEATRVLHGPQAAKDAEDAGRALFSGEIAGLGEATLREVFASVPSSDHDRQQLGAGVALVDLLVQTQLAASRREAKEFLQSGSVSVNGVKAGAEDKVTSGHLLHGTMIALKRGKKQWHLTRWK